MKNNKTVYAIVPARKDSKRLPGKNKKIFVGKPLICWTIEEALKVKEIDYVIVSSNDDDIFRIAGRYRVILRNRPEELCLDNVPGHLVSLDAMEFVGAKDDSVVIYLQPTSPLRTAKDITGCYYHYKIMDCDSVISCYRNSKAYYSFKLQDGYLEPLFYGNYLRKQSNDLPEAFVPNGAVYVISLELLKEYGSVYTPRTKVFIMSELHSIDIDSLEEWLFAEFLMIIRLKKEGKNANRNL